MDVAVRDAPGVSTPFNWITDIGPPIDPNSLTSYQLVGSSGAYVGDLFYFWLNTVYNTQTGAVYPGSAGPMIFNRMGILGGPLKHANGTANVGGVVTISLYQEPSTGGGLSLIAQASVDLTTWVPGQFYWSDPLPSPITVWGQMFTPPSHLVNLYSIVEVTCTTPYSLYTNRPVTLLNGGNWGSKESANGSNNDHLALGGPIDFSLINYADLGTAKLAPTFALSGHMQAEGRIGALSGISPQIQFRSRLHTIGDLGTADMEPSVILRATSMAGGPLWKPSKLCSG